MSTGRRCQHERVNSTPLRGVGGTKVSKSTLPQGQWWSDAFETRQRRIKLKVHHKGCWNTVDYLCTVPSHYIRALHDRENKRQWTQWETQSVTLLDESWWMCRCCAVQGLKHQKRTTWLHYIARSFRHKHLKMGISSCSYLLFCVSHSVMRGQSFPTSDAQLVIAKTLNQPSAYKNSPGLFSSMTRL